MNLMTSQPPVSRRRKIALLTSGILLLSLSGIAAIALTANVEEQASSGRQATMDDQPQSNVEPSAGVSSEATATQQAGSPAPSTGATASTPQIYRPGELYHIGGGVSAPELVYAPDPEFSDRARRAKYQGACVISLIVNTRGNPQQVKLVRHLGMGLDQKAVEAVKQYRFTPAMLQGRPVPVKVNIEVNFRLY